jgi:uncharacterized protein YqjF (DUF2071 family)
MYQRWTHITFIHWRYDPSAVRPLVPEELELDLADGAAWVALTPFLVEDLRLPGMPVLPWFSRFPETNLRTYVRGPDGRRGVWFLSLDCARVHSAVGGRLLYFQPYWWSKLSIERSGHRIRYRGRRRSLGSGPGYEVEIEAGDPYAAEELGELDHFLTARWVLYAFYGRTAASAQVEHPPWPLRRARVVSLRQDLTSRQGLPPPSGAPVAHHSEGVAARIGPPRVIRG